MRVGSQRHFTSPAQHFAETWVAGQIGSQDEWVYEETDQRLGLNHLASRRRRTYDDIFLPAVTK